MALLRTPRRLRRHRRRAAPPAASRRTLDRLRMILDLSRLPAVSDPDALLGQAGATAASLLGAERGQVYLHDTRSGETWTPRPSDPEACIPARPAFLAAVLAGGRAVRHHAGEHGPLEEPLRSLVAAPLPDVDLAPLGVIAVADKREGEFSEEDAVLLELLAEQTAVGLQRFRGRQAAGQAAELRHEMEIARGLQASLIPAVPPRLEDAEVVGWTRTASVTGGDAFDVWTLPGDRLGVFLGDASGHGLPAALVIAQVRTLVRSLSEIESEPEWLLSRVNTRLAQDLPDGRFATAFVATVARGGTVRWSSAGQGPVFVRRTPDVPYDVLQAPAVPLGVSHELIADATPAVALEPGGVVVVASDGVLEARDGAQELLGPARLLQVLDECGGMTAAEIAATVRRRLDEWQGSEEAADDQTVLVIRRTAS